ncbi:MAG: hypothetical protein ACRCZF_02785, partial [Gemmataceae bacterium]
FWSELSPDQQRMLNNRMNIWRLFENRMHDNGFRSTPQDHWDKVRQDPQWLANEQVQLLHLYALQWEVQKEAKRLAEKLARSPSQWDVLRYIFLQSSENVFGLPLGGLSSLSGVVARLFGEKPPDYSSHPLPSMRNGAKCVEDDYQGWIARGESESRARLWTALDNLPGFSIFSDLQSLWSGQWARGRDYGKSIPLEDKLELALQIGIKVLTAGLYLKSVKNTVKGSSGKSTPTGGKSELKHSISNVGDKHAARNAANLAEYDAGAVLSGVYDPVSGKYILRPSGPTKLKGGGEPMYKVGDPQTGQGGHLTLNDDLDIGIRQFVEADTSKTMGFTVRLEANGELTVSTYSNGVNLPNHRTQEVVGPLRDQLLKDLKDSTGRTVRWVDIDTWRGPGK